MTDVPAVLRSALAQRSEARLPETLDLALPSRVCEGDLRVVEALAHSPTDRRVGVVLRVDSANDFAEVLLVHAYPELATDRDVILPADVTSAPYDAVVQTDLRAAVWSLQLGKRIGHLAELELAAVKAIGNGPSAVELDASPTARMPQLHSGNPLAGPLDRRWSFKESEGAALRALAADCTEALLDQELAWEVNPGLLRPDLLDLADDPELLVIELLHWVQTRRLSLTDDDLELLLGAGALELDAWLQLSDLGADLLIGFQEILLRVATGVTSKPRSEARCMLTAAHLGAMNQEPHDRVHYLAAKEPVPT
ncbi:MAG: hypothetical protein AAGA65_25040 [Actinomycetota bacterium]